MFTVKDILDKKGHDVWTISPEAKMVQALKLMADKGCGALVVLVNGKAKGMISERDYARKVVSLGQSLLETPVREIMTRCVYFVGLETTVEECMTLMTQHRVRHLPVMNEDRLEGLVSIGDVVKSLIDQHKQTIEHLENYISGKYL
jgi:CBS domain-containing protein